MLVDTINHGDGSLGKLMRNAARSNDAPLESSISHDLLLGDSSLQLGDRGARDYGLSR